MRVAINGLVRQQLIATDPELSWAAIAKQMMIEWNAVERGGSDQWTVTLLCGRHVTLSEPRGLQVSPRHARWLAQWVRARYCQWVRSVRAHPHNQCVNTVFTARNDDIIMQHDFCFGRCNLSWLLCVTVRLLNDGFCEIASNRVRTGGGSELGFTLHIHNTLVTQPNCTCSCNIQSLKEA